MNGLEDNNKENVTNVYNSTVNNMTILTSTIACIEYMRRNKKAMVIPVLITILTFIMLITSIVLLCKTSNMYGLAHKENTNVEDRIMRIEGELKEINKRIDNNDVAIVSAKNSTDSLEADITSMKKKLDNSEKNQKASIEQNQDAADMEVNNEPIETVTELRKMKIVSGRSAEVVRKATNTLGEEFDNAILLNGRGDAHVTYYLGKKYTKLSCMISCPDEDHITEGTYPLEVFANNDSNQQLFYMDFGRNTATTPIELDVTGIDFITFRVTKNSVLYDAVGLVINEGLVK